MRQRSRNSSVAEPLPEVLGDDRARPSPESPTSSAAAPSPPADSSGLVGRPVRRSEVTTSVVPGPSSAMRSAPTPERTAPPRSSAGAVRVEPQRRVDRGGVRLVEVRRVRGREPELVDPARPGAARIAARAASTPIVVVSSSYDATDRVPLPPPLPKVRAISDRCEPPVRHVPAGADDSSHGHSRRSLGSAFARSGVGRAASYSDEMRLGDITNPDAQAFGKPLDGIRVLAAEQMQALPYATQMLARLGAEVVKVEHPVHGESGRASTPAMLDPEGRKVGATYLRNNLNKRSVGLDLKSPEGRELFLALGRALRRRGRELQGRDDGPHGPRLRRDRRRAPAGDLRLDLRASATPTSRPYRDWPAYASIVEAMSGIYEYKSGPDQPPVTIPVGALGDISSALFAVIGILAALRHREHTGLGQYVDVAMLDAMVAMTDVVTNFWSMGVRPEPGKGLEVICEGFRASDGYVVVQISREHQFEALAELIGHPEWKDDPRFATRAGWAPNLETGDPPGGRRVGVRAHEARGRPRAHRGRDRGRAEQLGGRRDRRSPRGRPQHARRGAADRRRRPPTCSFPATR